MKMILKTPKNKGKKKIYLGKIVRYQLTKSDCQSDNKKNGLSDIIINNIIRVRALALTMVAVSKNKTRRYTTRSVACC